MNLKQYIKSLEHRVEFEKYVILYESKTKKSLTFDDVKFEKYVILYESKT